MDSLSFDTAYKPFQVLYEDGGSLGFDSIEAATKWAGDVSGWKARHIAKVIDKQCNITYGTRRNKLQNLSSVFNETWYDKFKKIECNLVLLPLSPPAPPAVQSATDEPECKFYVIWCPESDKPIKNKYTLSRAIKVIAEMRAKYPDSTFHIMGKVDE